MKQLRIAGYIIASVLIILSLYLSNATANESAHTADLTRQAALQQKSDQHIRQIAVCKSSSDLRALLNDLGNLIVQANPPGAGRDVFVKRIHEYTDTNPNCNGIALPPPTGNP